MYQASFINRLSQFGYTSYDLILTDDAGVMPEIRLMKEFKDGGDANLDAIGVDECSKATQTYQDEQTRQWVIQQIQEAAGLVEGYIQSTDANLTTLSNVDAIINPVLGFYGLPASSGLRPLLAKRLNANTATIIEAFKTLPITETSVATTEYFVQQVKQALGVN